MKIKGHQRQMLSAKESFYVGESVMNAFEQDDEHEMKVYTAGEHKRGDDGHYYGYATIAHPRMGEFVVSFNTSDGRPMTNGYPWEFLEKDQLTHEQAAWVMRHQEQLADKLKEGGPEFDFVEYAKMQPRLFNPQHVAFNKGEIFRLHENVYYGNHDAIGQMLDIEEDYDQPLTEDGKRRIEEAAVKHGLKFDRAEDMFYFPRGTLAEVVDVNGPSGWPVLRINEVEYDFAGDPFKVSFGGSNDATENVKPRKVAKETFNRKARKFSKEAYEELIASMEAEGDEFTIPEEYIMNPTEVNFKKILQERDRKREEEAKAKAEQERKAALAEKYKGIIDKINQAPEVTLDSSTDKLSVAFDALVPPDGKSDTVAGEIVRALMRLLYRWYNDGDYFYKGYGIDTLASSVQYLALEAEMLDDEAVERLMESDPDEDEYERTILRWANEIMDELVDMPELFGTPNEVDSRDYDTDWIEANQPKYEFEVYASDDLEAHMDKGNCDVWALKSYVEEMLSNDRTTRDAEVERPWGHNDKYLTVTGLTQDGKETLEDWFRNPEAFWADLVDELTEENGDPYAEDEEEEDEDYDDENPADEAVDDSSKPANERIEKEDAIPDEDWIARLNVIDVGNVETWPAEKIQAIFGDDAYWSDLEQDIMLGDEGWDGKIRRNGKVVAKWNFDKAKAEPILLEEATNHFTTVGGMRPGMRIHLPEYGQVWMTVKDVKSIDPWRVALTLDTNGSTQTLTVGKNSLWYLDPASDTKGATESATAAGSQAKSKSF